MEMPLLQSTTIAKTMQMRRRTAPALLQSTLTRRHRLSRTPGTRRSRSALDRRQRLRPPCFRHRLGGFYPASGDHVRGQPGSVRQRFDFACPRRGTFRRHAAQRRAHGSRAGLRVHLQDDSRRKLCSAGGWAAKTSTAEEYAGLTIEATRHWSHLMVRPVTLL